MFSNEFFDVDDKGFVFDKDENVWGRVVRSPGTGKWIWSDGSDSEWYQGPELIRIGLLLTELDAGKVLV
jgi:hypothetical protein